MNGMQLGRKFGNGEVVVSSLDIAELTGRRHADVMRDIRKISSRLYEVGESIFIKDFYINLQNKKQPKYLITSVGCDLLLPRFKGGEKLALLNFINDTCNDSKIVAIEPRRKELLFTEELKEVLSPIGLTLNVQYVVGRFKLDGYIPEINLAIEYDELHHKYKEEEDAIRQNYVESKINCKFVRCSEVNNNNHNIGLVMNEIIKLKARF